MLETGSTVLFPLVIPIDEENQIFSGYIPIHVKKKELYIPCQPNLLPTSRMMNT
jgi:hypothetical protein